jgi:hypothetical protein
MLYSVETASGEHRLAWYVPIYWQKTGALSDETIYLAGFAIVDASDTNKLSLVINQEGLTSEQLVRETRLNYVKFFTAAANVEVTTAVTAKYTYVEEGTTHIVLRLDDEVYSWVEATPKTLSTAQWRMLMATEPGDTVTVRVEPSGDRWIITGFLSNSTVSQSP